MVAYNFQAQFADDVESRKKRQTIRAWGKKRHAFPGEPVQLYTGQRTAHCRKLVDPDPHCNLRAPITIDFCTVRLAFKMLDVDEIDQMAEADGFTDRHEFFEFFRKAHGFPFEGLLIGWD